MPELERTLARLGAALDWPETPDLARSVRARLEAEGAERPPGGARPSRAPRFPLTGLRRSLVLAALALLILAGGVYAAVPAVRDAVQDLLGLEGATVERRATLPEPPPPERALDLGTPMTLGRATGLLGFTPLIPQLLGEPDRVYLREGLPGGELSLAYGPRPGLPRARSTRLGALLSEFRGDLSPEYLAKVVGPATTTERLRIDGNRAIWIEGAPHFLLYRGPDGQTVESTLRIAQNALLVDRDDLLIRLEGAFDRARATALARSLR